jgi:hypothetical protein
MKSRYLEYILFGTRLFLYLFAFLIPFIHPAIVVPYDLVGIVFWFFIVPGEMAIAFFLSPPKFDIKIWLISAVCFPAVILFFIMGISLDTLSFFLGALLFFFITAVIFKTEGRGHPLAVLEIFFLAFLYYKYLNFSRASELIAEASSGITQIILIVCISAFFIHAVVLYLSSFPKSLKKRGRREIFLFTSMIVPLALLLALILPPDAVKNVPFLNTIQEDIETVPLDGSDRGIDDGGGTEGEDGLGGEKGELEGIPSDQWGDNISGRGGTEGKEYAVMIVATPISPVYAAEMYYDNFDPVKGFLYNNGNYLNQLNQMRLIESWQWNDWETDRMREPIKLFFLSIPSQRVLAYKPYTVEPTILNEKNRPFSYIYRSVSGISFSTEEEWFKAEGLSKSEKEKLKDYLKLDLKKEHEEVFQDYVDYAYESGENKLKEFLAEFEKKLQEEDNLTEEVIEKINETINQISARIKELENNRGYYVKLWALLNGFSIYQYEIGFEEHKDVEFIADFLSRTKTGDCTEFSNALAILARMVGIPSRVVTGYLASHDLQQMTHKRGIAILREKIDILKEFPIEDLILVTTMHAHSWTQVYIPEYGWIDIETTSTAIPPPMGFGFGNNDVVIPIYEKDHYQSDRFVFPWMMLTGIVVLALVLLITGLYTFRYLREAYLFYRSRKNDEAGLRALYELLLMKLAACGFTVKPRSKTALEYAKEYPQLTDFARLYTELHYNLGLTPEAKARFWKYLRESYQKIITESTKPGFIPGVRRIFSLQGLKY